MEKSDRGWTVAEYRYSPLGVAAGTFVLVAMLLLFLTLSSGEGKGWYWGIVALPIIGLIVHCGTSRVLYVHLVAVMCQAATLAAVGALLHQFTTDDLQLLPSTVALVMLAPVFLLVSIGVIRDRNSALRAALPCGWDGTLDERTGIVDPNAKSSVKKTEVRAVARSTISRLFVVLLGAALSSQALLPAVPYWTKAAAFVVVLSLAFGWMAMRLGMYWSMIEATIRWEREHDKKIRVLRGRRTT